MTRFRLDGWFVAVDRVVVALLRTGDYALLTVQRLRELLQLIRGDGYRWIGPTLRDGAIVLGEIEALEDLPVGWSETQQAGQYRLVPRSDAALFGYSTGPQSLKPLFFAPRMRLFSVRRKGRRFDVEPGAVEPPRLALLGARACDLHALEIQDRVFLHGAFVDPDYAARRRDVFVVAVQCGQAGGTCFCASMGTGPRARGGFDLALTELFDPHRLLVEVGSPAGAACLDRIAAQPAAREDIAAAEAISVATERSMGRHMDTTEIRELFERNAEHPRWDAVADRCLACTNCTLACPTCFCASVEDTSDLAGETAERVRRWDSCFTLDHSYLHGGSVHASTRARYRQWLTHKLATWIDQFGVSGCVGCGRCITWCPVGIDITEEVAAIRQSDGAPR